MGEPQRLADLREPPVPGRYYLVPIIRDYPWHGKRGDWPVLGPLHEDAEFFGFSEVHYHVDVRFLTARLRNWAARQLVGRYQSNDIERDLALVASAYPLSSRGEAVPKGRPATRRLKCIVASHLTPLLKIAPASIEAALANRYGSPAAPIRKADGRILCPHRKVDLSQFPPDNDGTVTCPLHGLKVCVGMPA